LLGSVEKHLNGKVKMDWHPAGLTCHIAIPADTNLELIETPVRTDAEQQSIRFQKSGLIIVNGLPAAN
jgi:hypothetical protein